MTNAERIQVNNAELREAIEIAESLPDDRYSEDDFVKRSLSGAYTNDRVTYIGQFAFRGCTKITSFSFPNVAAVETNAFYGIKATSVDLPACTTIADNAFTNANSLVSVNVPMLLTLIGSYTFRACYSLKAIDLPVLTSIKASTFYDCRRLTAVILRKTDAICTLASTNAFTNCYHFHGTTNSTYNPNGDKDGYIYVPSALVDSYKTATNWSTFASQFRAIEDYPEIVT